MKLAKKFAGVITAAALSMCMFAGLAFAAPSAVPGKTAVSVTGVANGDTVTAYTIATAQVTDSNELVFDFVAEAPEAYNTVEEVTGATDKAAMFNAFATAIPATSDAAASAVAPASMNLTPGYYLFRVTSTSGDTKVYQYSVQYVAPEIVNGKYTAATEQTVEVKSVAAPSVAKTINGQASTDAYRNDTFVPMVITTAIPSYPADATSATFTVVDTAVNFSAIQNVVVKGNGATLFEGADYTISENVAASFTITFTDAYIKAHPGAPIEISYDANLAGKEAADGKATNSVYATFNPSPYNAATANTNTATVSAQTYGFYFQKLGEADAGSVKPVLPGTIFELKKGNNVIATLTADENGYVYFAGLEAGTYTLTETRAGVAGYGTVEPFTVTLSADACTVDNPATANVAETNYVAAGTNGEVVDPKASVPTLPITGGMGTIAFSVIGVAIMAAAVVMFMRRKQSDK